MSTQLIDESMNPVLCFDRVDYCKETRGTLILFNNIFLKNSGLHSSKSFGDALHKREDFFIIF